MGTLRTESITDTQQLAQLMHSPTRERARAILAAAQTGLPYAQTLLGQILLNGEGIEQDRDLVLTWFNIAAHAQEPMAFNMLGRCHEHGWGVEKNECAAVAYYQKAADLGLDWGQYNLANLLATGRGIERDATRAVALYQQAAEQGHAKSMNLLGRCYEEAVGVEQDTQAALLWYQRSAQGGDFRGQYSLATVLLNQGQIDAALPWLQAALAGGNLNFLRATRAALRSVQHPSVQAIAQAFYEKAAQLGDHTDRDALADINPR